MGTMILIKNLGKVIGLVEADRSMTDEEAFEALGMIKQETDYPWEVDYRSYNGKDYRFDDLSTETISNKTRLYIVIDHKGCDEWTETYNNLYDAIKEAHNQWNLMCNADQKNRDEFYVLESVADTIEADNAFDGDRIAEWT